MCSTICQITQMASSWSVHYLPGRYESAPVDLDKRVLVCSLSCPRNHIGNSLWNSFSYLARFRCVPLHNVAIMKLCG